MSKVRLSFNINCMNVNVAHKHNYYIDVCEMMLTEKHIDVSSYMRLLLIL